MEPKEEPIDDFPLMPTEKEIQTQSVACQKKPKEEPLDLFTDKIPQQSFMGEKICKKEEMDEDEMASSDFDVSAFGPPIDHFPIPLEIKEEIIEAGEDIEESKEKASSETVVIQKKRRPAINSSKSLLYAESVEDPVGNKEPSEKKSRSESDERTENCPRLQFPLYKPYMRIQLTPQCVLCDTHPTSAYGYSIHLHCHHQSSLAANGIYLICSCGIEVRNFNYTLKHNKDCDGSKFSLHSLSEEAIKSSTTSQTDNPTLQSDTVILTPKCVLCEMFPSSVYGYGEHLHKHHKSTLIANGIYLLCECGKELRSKTYDPNHNKKCNGRQFTIRKLEEKIHTTPQCVLCEVHPSTANGYVQHLQRQHKTTLIENGISLLCSCGIEARTAHSSRKHNGECDGRQFTVQNVPKA